jgi:hypothetical protein
MNANQQQRLNLEGDAPDIPRLSEHRRSTKPSSGSEKR